MKTETLLALAEAQAQIVADLKRSGLLDSVAAMLARMEQDGTAAMLRSVLEYKLPAYDERKVRRWHQKQ